MLDPEAPDERRDEIATNARGRIESSGTLKTEKAWGLRKMAYEIQQRTEADYRFFRFETESPLLDELDHNLKITDGVLRFRIFKVDPDSPVVDPPPPTSLASSAPRGDGRGRRDRDDGPPPAAAAPAPAPAEAPRASRGPGASRGPRCRGARGARGASRTGRAGRSPGAGGARRGGARRRGTPGRRSAAVAAASAFFSNRGREFAGARLRLATISESERYVI